MTAIVDIHELVARIDIVDFVVHEERARRVVWPEGTAPEGPQSTLRLAIRLDGSQIGFRFKLTLADPVAEYVADIEAVYQVEDDESGAPELRSDLVKDFAGRVAFMAVYPYLRTTVFSAAGRLGMPAPVMGIVRQGQFEAGVEMDMQEAEEQFNDTTSDLTPTGGADES